MAILMIGRSIITGPEFDELDRIIYQGRLVTDDIRSLKQELGEVNAEIIEYAADYDCRCHFIAKDTDCHIQTRVTYEVTNVEELKRLLGSRFEDLVERNVSFRPTKKLRDMFDNGQFRSCMASRKSTFVSYKEFKEGR